MIPSRSSGNKADSCLLASIGGQAAFRRLAQRPLGYNHRFDCILLRQKKTMEAERINSLANLLADLTTREAELRRYL
jgi:peptide chain release factor 2